MAVISGHNLSCVKRDRLLFEGVEFSVGQSELLYIKGPNGAGKTSLLRILVGLSSPEEGHVAFQGQDIATNRDNFHRALVYFGHKLGLNLHLSGIENLTYWCRQQGFDVSEQHLFNLLGELGLVGLETLPVASLSAGQQRRVALARLWLKEKATLWILDEPFTALDVDGIALLEQKILAHLANGGSVIMTSHQALQLDYPVKELTLEYLI